MSRVMGTKLFMFTLWVGLKNEEGVDAAETAVLATSEISEAVVSTERAAELMIVRRGKTESKKMEGSMSVCSDYHEEWQFALNCIDLTMIYI
jgi:hypothetical protein